jgi:acyl-CoA thioesterase I
MLRRAFSAVAAALILTLAPGMGRAAEFVACTTPPAFSRIEPSLERAAERVMHRQPVTIVAIGSSSTQGVGATEPALNYPSRLEAELRARFPGIGFRVINRGRAGEDVGEEVARLTNDVIAERPDLAIWQLGTNAVLRRDDLLTDAEVMQRGVAMLRKAGIDVVLMDLQYAPRVLDRPAYAMMEELIADTAERTGAALFRRFAMMRYWQGQPAGPSAIGPDGLHMNDQGYGCLATALADALAMNWRSHAKAMTARPSVAPEALGGLTQVGAGATTGR